MPQRNDYFYLLNDCCLFFCNCTYENNHIIYCCGTPINYQRLHTKYLASSCWLFCWKGLRNTQKRVFIELFFQSFVERLMEGHEFFAVLQVKMLLPQHIFWLFQHFLNDMTNNGFWFHLEDVIFGGDILIVKMYFDNTRWVV